MPVHRTLDGRIVEERTNVTPPGSGGKPERKRAGHDEPFGPPAEGKGAAESRPHGAGYADPTVVRRPGGVTAGRQAPRDDERTRLAGAVPTDSTGSQETDPVAGWLVIVEGPGVGRDLRIGIGRNDLGRDRDNRIGLPFGDARISRRAHLWVNYDPLNQVFSVAPETAPTSGT